MEIGKLKILGLAIVLLLSGAIIPTLAYMYFWQTDPIVITNGVVLNQYPTPTMSIGVYWDVECTQPVTIIDFGEMVHPRSREDIWKTMYIRNEGDVWHVIRWNSTLSSITTELTDYWEWYQPYRWYNLDGTELAPGTVLETQYKLRIPGYASIGTYNWTLNVWGEHWY